jgi:hypothetical protein
MAMPDFATRLAHGPRIHYSGAFKLRGPSSVRGNSIQYHIRAPLIQVQINCILPVLLDMECSHSNLTAFSSCVCLNLVAESKMANCVVRNCNYSELVKVEKAQYELCYGQPKPSRSGSILAATIALACLVIIFVGLRFWSRYTISKKFWWDDWFLLASTLLFLVLQAVNVWGVQMGFGVHVWNTNPGLNEKLYQVSILFLQLEIRAEQKVRMDL